MNKKTVDEWLEYFSSPHKARNPSLHCYGGEVVRFFNNPNVRGFYLRSGEGEEAVISTRCMAVEKYLAIERVASYCYRHQRVLRSSEFTPRACGRRASSCRLNDCISICLWSKRGKNMKTRSPGGQIELPLG